MRGVSGSLVRVSKDLCRGCSHAKKETEIEWEGVFSPNVYHTVSVILCTNHGKNAERSDGMFTDLFSKKGSVYPFPLAENINGNGLCAHYKPSFWRRVWACFSAAIP